MNLVEKQLVENRLKTSMVPDLVEGMGEPPCFFSHGGQLGAASWSEPLFLHIGQPRDSCRLDDSNGRDERRRE